MLKLKKCVPQRRHINLKENLEADLENKIPGILLLESGLWYSPYERKTQKNFSIQDNLWLFYYNLNLAYFSVTVLESLNLLVGF